MTKLLVRLFIRQPGEPVARESFGLLSGWVGLVCNLLLFAVKLLTGLFTGSIAIMADAVNNLSDSASAVITLAVFKLSAKPADDEHPYGHARFEYLGGMVISCIVLVIGVQFLISSVQKILAPAPVRYTPAVAFLLLVSILLKLWLALFYRAIGRRIGSQALLASSADSRNDLITTAVILASAVAAHYTGLLLDGWMGLVVAVFIAWSGFSMLREALNPLLGAAPDSELVGEITRKVLAYPSVCGIHDMMVHNYGPDRCFASLHVEIPATQDIMVSHEIIDEIERDFLATMGIQMVIHFDPVILDDPKLDSLRERIIRIATGIDPCLSIHDFRMVAGPNHTNLIFDVTLPHSCKLSDRALRESFYREVAAMEGSYYAVITVDRSYIVS